MHRVMKVKDEVEPQSTASLSPQFLKRGSEILRACSDFLEQSLSIDRGQHRVAKNLNCGPQSQSHLTEAKKQPEVIDLTEVIFCFVHWFN